MAPLVARVFAFEPDASAFATLTANLAQAPNAEAVRAAVSSASGTAELTVGEGGFSQIASLRDAGTVRPDAGVKVVTIDSWMAAHPGPAVTCIKIDVDGHDLEVLRGATGVIARDRAIVLTEFLVGANSSNDHAALAEIVTRLGYHMFAYCVRKDRKKVFQRVGVESLKSATFKMLFLVPPEKLDDVSAFVGECNR
jgi:FkbM family methyltransferase